MLLQDLLRHVCNDLDWFVLFAGLLIGFFAMASGTVVMITKMIIKHRERTQLIEQGIHPDYPPEEVDENNDPVKP